MKSVYKKFWKWYEKHKTLNLGIATVLFSLQVVHLIWLYGDVIHFRLTGERIFNLVSNTDETPSLFHTAIIAVDYLEIPAIIATSLVYINELRKKFNYKSVWLLIFINSQWLHLFWITDELVVGMFSGTNTTTILPLWLAWSAIFVDYLELPVVYDTLKKFFHALKDDGIEAALGELKED